MNLPAYPVPGAPLTASWGRLLIDYLRSVTPLSGPRIMVKTSPCGTVFEPVASVSSYVPPVWMPWAIELKGLKATFRRCAVRRSWKTFVFADIEDVTLSGSTECWVGVKIDTETGTAEIISGSARSDACHDSAEPSGDDARYIRLLLYTLVRASAEGKSWLVRDNWVMMPVTQLWG